MKRLAILGSTGSIGRSALAVVDAHPERLVVTGLAAGVIPILIAVGLIGTGQGESANNLMLSLSSLLGAGGATVAAGAVHKQQKEGLHDPALPPADQAIESNRLEAELGQHDLIERLDRVIGELNDIRDRKRPPETGVV